MRVYLFRGLAGAIFSTGMDRLADKLSKAGHEASVHAWIERTGIQAEALDQFAAGRLKGPVAVVGHSLGGNSANYMGRNLAKAGVPVAYIATVDPTEPDPAPAGVACDNFRSRDFRAEKVEGAADNFRPDLNHVEIDKDEAVHRRILDMCATAKPALPGVNKPADELAAIANLLGKGDAQDAGELEKLLSALAGNPMPEPQPAATDPQKLPVNFALGKAIGGALNGKKTGLGIVGLLATTVLPVVFPQLAPVKAILGAIGLEGAAAAANPGQGILTPLFAALSSWGVLGKFEKWAVMLSGRK